MKKILSVLIVLALCASFFACGNENNPQNDNKPTSEPTQKATEEVKETEVPEPTPEPTATPEPKFGKENLALEKPVEVDGVEGDFAGEYAVDGDDATRWSGLGAESEAALHFIKIDLEKTYNIGYVAVLWESCNASFFIELLDENGARVEYAFCDAATEDLYTENFLKGKAARYVVLHVSKTAFASPFEIEVYEQLVEETVDENTQINLAIAGTASALKSENDALTPEKAIDGDYTTRWAPGGNGFDEDMIWTLDLGAVKTIDEINIYFESNQTDYCIEIAADENGSWETVYEWDETDVAGKQTISVGGKEARFVRYVRPAGAEGWCSFFEFEVIGK